MSAPSPQRPLRPRGRRARSDREDIVVGNEIVRHNRASRLIHWTVAADVLRLRCSRGCRSGRPIFGWMAHLFGGLSRLPASLHPVGRSGLLPRHRS